MPEPTHTRYEKIIHDHSHRPDDAAALLHTAARTARIAIPADTEHDQVIRDVAAGVAAPALIGATCWMLCEARRRGLERLRFLSRDGQIFYELARRLAPLADVDLGMEYVYSSRMTWSLAATDPQSLDRTAWLFNSFMKSNAADLCARLGLPTETYAPLLQSVGVSLAADARADQADQADAMRRFLTLPEVTEAATARIANTRDLLIDYAAEHNLTDPRTGLVDAGWTGRMIGSLLTACETTESRRPHVLLWGHEPRSSGWTDPDRVTAYMYNTATQQGLDVRVPDAPFVVETFCMGEHGIVTGYQRNPSGGVESILQSANNPAAEAWGLRTYRSTIYAVADELTEIPTDNLRPLIHQLMNTFWRHPTTPEANAWGRYPYDSDPAGTAVRPLARPLDPDNPTRGDRAWLSGALALSNPETRHRYLESAEAGENHGDPASD
ncbi:hypothetical protein [Nocardia australiensis]|uniref:hypothetical protein n=1 Tax=Nocardia australiensis TaxID=2887191 RepID=UPI001D1587A4|nr:hypothetical protein [Nocardia australiensis]